MAQGHTAIQTTDDGVEALDRRIDGAADEPYVLIVLVFNIASPVCDRWVTASRETQKMSPCLL